MNYPGKGPFFCFYRSTKIGLLFDLRKTGPHAEKQAESWPIMTYMVKMTHILGQNDPL